jgi:hypothetical protein
MRSDKSEKNETSEELNLKLAFEDNNKADLTAK